MKRILLVILIFTFSISAAFSEIASMHMGMHTRYLLSDDDTLMGPALYYVDEYPGTGGMKNYIVSAIYMPLWESYDSNDGLSLSEDVTLAYSSFYLYGSETEVGMLQLRSGVGLGLDSFIRVSDKFSTTALGLLLCADMEAYCILNDYCSLMASMGLGCSLMDTKYIRNRNTSQLPIT